MIYSAPSHLTELVAEVDKATLSNIQKLYGGNTTAFSFDSIFHCLLLSYNEDARVYGGRIWGVSKTGKKLLIFDQGKHGYNGTMGLNEEDDIGSTGTIDLSKAIEVVIAFQYNGDEADYIEDGTSRFAQDYFSWLAIYKRENSRLEEMISFECA